MIHSSDIQVTLMIHSGDIQELPETFRTHSGDIQVTFMIHSGEIQDLPKISLNIHETFRVP